MDDRDRDHGHLTKRENRPTHKAGHTATQGCGLPGMLNVRCRKKLRSTAVSASHLTIYSQAKCSLNTRDVIGVYREKNGLRGCLRSQRRTAPGKGSSMLTHKPLPPSPGRAEMCPPCRPTMLWQIASPRPLPGY